MRNVSITLKAGLYISAQVADEVCVDSSIVYVLVYIVLIMDLSLRIAGSDTICF